MKFFYAKIFAYCFSYKTLESSCTDGDLNFKAEIENTIVRTDNLNISTQVEHINEFNVSKSANDGCDVSDYYENYTNRQNHSLSHKQEYISLSNDDE